MSTVSASDCVQAGQRQWLYALLRDHDLDGAIAAGLMDFRACGTPQAPRPCCAQAAPLLQAQQRLVRAWAARDRYRARQARLARRAAERDARRAPAAVEKKTGLPPTAAAILARAKAKAAGRSPE